MKYEHIYESLWLNGKSLWCLRFFFITEINVKYKLYSPFCQKIKISSHISLFSGSQWSYPPHGLFVFFFNVYFTPTRIRLFSFVQTFMQMTLWNRCNMYAYALPHTSLRFVVIIVFRKLFQVDIVRSIHII